MRHPLLAAAAFTALLVAHIATVLTIASHSALFGKSMHPAPSPLSQS